jgi:hypothetical protein
VKKKTEERWNLWSKAKKKKIEIEREIKVRNILKVN